MWCERMNGDLFDGAAVANAMSMQSIAIERLMQHKHPAMLRRLWRL